MPFVATTFPEFYLAQGANRQAVDNGDFMVWERGMDMEPSVAVGEPDRWHFVTDSIGGSFRLRRVSIGIEDRPKETHTDSALEIECLDQGELQYIADMRYKYYDAHYGAGEAVSVAAGIKPLLREFEARIIVTQHFGEGGSPDVVIDTGGERLLVNQWNRLEYVCDMPSVLGKTFGPGGDDHIRIAIRNAAMLTGEKVRITGVQMNLGGIALPFYSRGAVDETVRALAHRERVVGLDKGYLAIGTMITVDTAVFMFPLTYKINPSTDVYNTGLDTYRLHVGGTINEIDEMFVYATYPGMSFMTFKSIGLTRTIGEGCFLKTYVVGAGLDFGRDAG